MKKVLFVLFAVLLAVVVSGCSSSSQKPASATDSAAKQETERSGAVRTNTGRMRLSISRARRMLKSMISARRRICRCLPHGERTRR